MGQCRTCGKETNPALVKHYDRAPCDCICAVCSKPYRPNTGEHAGCHPGWVKDHERTKERWESRCVRC